MQTWQTARLIARPPRPEDFDGYRELLGDPAINHWLQSPPRKPFGEAKVREWHEGDLEHWQRFGFGPWVLIERAGGEMVGRGGLHWIELGGDRIVEFPWAIGSRHQGKGLATEAVTAAVEWARSLGIDDAIALIEPANLASRRVAEKAGLQAGEELEYDGVLHLAYRRYAGEMRPLRYSINVTLDGCYDHRAIPAGEDLHRHAAELLGRADALLFGRVTYEMMEEAWRPPAPTGARPNWMDPFAETIDAAKKYVVSSTLEQVDWNAELVRGDLGEAVEQLKREPGNGLYVGGVTLPLALTELGLIDEYEFVVHPMVAGHGPTLFAELSKPLALKLVDQLEIGSGAVAMRYEPRR